MKLICHAMKGLIAAAAVLLLFSAAPVKAGTVTLTGQVDGYVAVNVSHAYTNTPVSLELNWADTGVSQEGVSTIVFRPMYGNTMLLKIGSNISIDSEPVYGGDTSKTERRPFATFTDGVLTDFRMYYYDATLDGVGGAGSWAVDIIKEAAGNTYLSFNIYQENLATVDWFYGHLDLPPAPGAAPVPLPASVMFLGSGLACLFGFRRKKLG